MTMAEGENLNQGTGDDAPDADAVAAVAAAEAMKATEEAKAVADAAAEAAKPIEYEAFEMPTGMEVDKAAMEEFTPLLQSGKVSQEDAQGYVNVFSAAIKRSNDAHAKSWNEAMGKWHEEAKADPEIGGDKWSGTEAHVALALKKLSPPNSKDENGKDLGTNPLENIFKLTGIGNHVEMVRLLDKVGMILSDDKLDLSHALGQTARTGAEIMYPTQGQ